MGKSDLGTLVGVIAGGALAATAGLSAPWIIGAAAAGGYIGNNAAGSSHYKPIYQH